MYILELAREFVGFYTVCSGVVLDHCDTWPPVVA